MCKLTEKSLDTKHTGYKVVLKSKQTGKYYSIAMGFEYQLNKPIPKIRVQKTKITYFREDLLKDKLTFHKLMVGRTAIFKYQYSARESFCLLLGKEQKHYETVILKMTIARDLMIGHYGEHFIIAGRMITTMKELSK